MRLGILMIGLSCCVVAIVMIGKSRLDRKLPMAYIKWSVWFQGAKTLIALSIAIFAMVYDFKGKV